MAAPRFALAVNKEFNMAESKDVSRKARTVKLCISRLGDRYATPGVSLGSEKVQHRGIDSKTGEPLVQTTTRNRVLLAGSFREVEEPIAKVLLKNGLCQEYNPEVHGELVDGDAVRYSRHLVGEGPGRVNAAAEDVLD